MLDVNRWGREGILRVGVHHLARGNGAMPQAEDDGTTIPAFGSKLHNPLFFRVQWSLHIGDLVMSLLAYRKFPPNCARRAI